LRFFGQLSYFLLSTDRQDINLNDPGTKRECQAASQSASIADDENIHGFLERMASRSGLIYYKSWFTYSFALRGFQEYLAAYWLADAKGIVDVVGKLANDNWQETSLWYAAITRTPQELVCAVLDADNVSTIVRNRILATLVVQNVALDRDSRKDLLTRLEAVFTESFQNLDSDYFLVLQLYRVCPQR
jgi:hypothetical protein